MKQKRRLKQENTSLTSTGLLEKDTTHREEQTTTERNNFQTYAHQSKVQKSTNYNNQNRNNKAKNINRKNTDVHDNNFHTVQELQYRT